MPPALHLDGRLIPLLSAQQSLVACSGWAKLIRLTVRGGTNSDGYKGRQARCAQTLGQLSGQLSGQLFGQLFGQQERLNNCGNSGELVNVDALGNNGAYRDEV